MGKRGRKTEFDYAVKEMDFSEYIGVPYVAGGRSKEGWDCYGLVKEFYRDNFFVDLPDWYADCTSLRNVLLEMTGHCKDEVEGHRAVELLRPEEFCIAFAYRDGHCRHMGIYIARGILHATKDRNTIFEHIKLFEMTYGQPRYFRWLR